MYVHDKIMSKCTCMKSLDLSCTYTISYRVRYDNFGLYVHVKVFRLIMYVHDKLGFIVNVHNKLSHTYTIREKNFFPCGGNTLPYFKPGFCFIILAIKSLLGYFDTVFFCNNVFGRILYIYCRP